MTVQTPLSWRTPLLEGHRELAPSFLDSLWNGHLLWVSKVFFLYGVDCSPIHSGYMTSPILVILSSVAQYHSLTMDLRVVMVNFPCWILSAKFNVAITCMAKAYVSCYENLGLSASQVVSIVRQSVHKNTMCREGGYELPTEPPNGSPYCEKSYSTDADNCMRTFREKFAANMANPDLCSWVKSLVESIVFLSYWQLKPYF